MHFTRNEARGDDRALAVGDRRTIIDGGDHGQAGDVQLGQIQRQESANADAVGEDPGSWPDQFGIDDAAIAALEGDRDFGPGGLIRFRLRVDFFVGTRAPIGSDSMGTSCCVRVATDE